MLSVTAAYDSMTNLLTVTGDSSANQIAITTSSGNVVVSDYGSSISISGGTPLASSVQSISVNGDGGNDTIDLSGVTSAFSSLDNNDKVSIVGGSGNDTITGSVWHDVIEGGTGNDTLAGGGSADRYVFSGTADLGTDTITETSELGANAMLDFSGLDFSIDANDTAAGVTIDLSDASSQTVIDHGGKTLTLDLTNAASKLSHIIGTDFDDVLSGNARQNTLTGGEGDDTYVFNETYTGASSDDDAIVEATAEGSDTLDFSGFVAGTSGLNMNLGTGFQYYVSGWPLSFTLGEVENVIGTPQNDTIHGNGLANALFGGDGADTLYGESGDDFLHGEAGGDSLWGGLGDDTLYGGDGNDLLSDWSTIDEEGGNDYLIGGAGNDTLHGLSENDLLDGGSGNDSLNGGAGNDTYRYAWTEGNPELTAQPALGTDTIDEVSGTDTLDFSAFHADDYDSPAPNSSGSNVTVSSDTDSQLILSYYYGIENFVEPSTLGGNPSEPTGGDEKLLYRPGAEGPQRSEGQDGSPMVAMNGDGDHYVAVWQYGANGTWYASIDGYPVGFAVTDDGDVVGLGIDDDGNVAVAWTDGSDTYISRYTSGGAVIGSGPTQLLSNPIWSFSMNDSGNYVVAWVDGTAVKTQRFDWDGNELDEDPLTASLDNESKGQPVVSIAANADYVVSWMSDVNYIGLEIDARYFSHASNAFVGSTIDVTEGDEPNQIYVLEPRVALNSNGNFAITWMVFDDGPEELSSMVQQFTVSGDLIVSGDELPIADWGSVSEISQAVVGIDGEGDIVVAWSEGNNEIYHVYGQAISRTGAILGERFQIDRPDQYEWTVGAGDPSDGIDFGPDPVNITMSEDGEFLVGFRSIGYIEDGLGNHVKDPFTYPEQDYYGGPDYRLFESPFQVGDGLFLEGDTNLDGYVDYADYLNVVQNFGRKTVEGIPFADVNGDDIIDRDDYLLVLANYGEQLEV